MQDHQMEPPTPDGVEDKYLQRAVDTESDAEKPTKKTKGKRNQSKRKKTPEFNKALPKDQSAEKKTIKFAGLTFPTIMKTPIVKKTISKTSLSNTSSGNNLKGINILSK